MITITTCNDGGIQSTASISTCRTTASMQRLARHCRCVFGTSTDSHRSRNYGAKTHGQEVLPPQAIARQTPSHLHPRRTARTRLVPIQTKARLAELLQGMDPLARRGARRHTVRPVTESASRGGHEELREFILPAGSGVRRGTHAQLRGCGSAERVRGRILLQGEEFGGFVRGRLESVLRVSPVLAGQPDGDAHARRRIVRRCRGRIRR
mmetsp:Transcript_11081/g.27263  ORF Transcript_11081/g.27263 Transcript_11081/m.27263 type:complete len:209 (+) Transcript_11081:43-669(+)